MLMEKEFDLFPRVGMNLEGGGVPTDSGSVVGKGGADLGLEVWSPYQDKLGKQHYAWMPAGLSATGFSFPLDYSYKDKTGVNTIRISNLGAKSLFVDAVIGYDEEVERE